MLSKIRNRRQLAAALRRDKGATDPILVIAAIAVSLILLIGGSFMVSNLINSGHDLNAKGDLDKVTIAEDSAFAAGDRFVAYKSAAVTTAPPSTPAEREGLEGSTIGFKPTDGQKVVVQLTGTPLGSAWIAGAKSKANTGTVFIKTSTSNKIFASTDTAALTAAGVTTVQVTALVTAIG